ncbi:MAG: ribosome recycling factor [Phycisphaerae bacterium SM23_33]|jgi:ribosome recycling factor|nr:MAG: ribosome recycling factor [Phycisphaerae bacterium SM23_33]
MPMDDILLECEEKMEKAVDFFHKELRGIRTGRASAGLVEHIRVDYYGSPTELRQLASIAVPEPDMIVIKPFDPGSAKDIERAIQASDLGITPITDGRIIRLPIPSLSVERRTRLAAQLKKMAEEARVTIRNIRRDANKDVDKEEKEGALTEDDARKCKEEIQSLTDACAKKIDQLLEEKNKEVMEA